TRADKLTAASLDALVLEIAGGEPSKSPAGAQDLWATRLDVGVHRDSVVLAVGGGVVGDLAGFVAATYARGLAFFQAPTSLLAQVDSSVGGKVGVNLPGGKNMVGAFWQPRGVIIDVAVLATLPDREYRAGLAEVVKYGVIMDADFFAFLEGHTAELNRRDPATLREVIARCCRLKADIVEADEREESGRRATLNYGHTVGHAIEAATNYQGVLHGEAVAIGMLCESRLAEAAGRVTAEETKRQHDLIAALHLPTACPEGLDAEELLRLMWRDKKVQAGEIRFVLPTKIGHAELVGGIAASSILSAVSG
ncbi:MAG: 3-dehydroquinate synthase, partial [Planctomycetota bacterium]